MLLLNQEQCVMNNPVAKNLNKFNKAKTFVDRKKNAKRGYKKHKGEY